MRVVQEGSKALAFELTKCWMEVANSGGAVGFPFIPVSEDEVATATSALLDELARGDVAIVEARRSSSLVGWVVLRFNRSPLTAHWATIERLQSHPSHRGTGVGAALLDAATGHARTLGLEQLRLALRSGENLESFYRQRGWQEIGRHRNALRLRAGDDRDEVLMTVDLGAP